MLPDKTKPRYEIGGSWGNHAEWTHLDRINPRVAGHHTLRPDNGDLLYSQMASGRTGVFRLQNVKKTSDPPDMWFADAVFVGYEDSREAS